MLNPIKGVLINLRKSFSTQADQAYRKRDDPEQGSHDSEHAAGEAAAFGKASDEVRDAGGK